MRIALLNIFYTIPLLINAGCESIPFKNQSTSIPFHLHDNRIMIPVIVNGRGPYNFVFDTGGARAHTMNLSLAKELDLDLDASKDQSGAGEKSQKTWSTMVSSYSISELNLKNQKFDVIDLSAIQKAFNFERLDGIIGYDVLQRSITCINFEKQILFLKNGKADCFDTNGITVPFRLDHDTPIISGEVNGIKTEFFIDTGDRSALSLFQKFAVKNGLENLFKNEKEIMTGMGVGGPIPGRIKSLNSVSLGPIKLQNVVSRLPSTKAGYFARSPLGGSLGNEVLRRFNLILDYSKNEITFFKNSKFDDPYQFVPPISDKKF